MRDRRYLLDLSQMLDGSGGEALLQEAFQRVDGERRQKALRLRNFKARAASVGAGLLLQRALADHAAGQLPEAAGQPERAGQTERIGQIGLECFSVEELLSLSDGAAAEPVYRYGSGGKPYLAEHSFQFNLSHSGAYVLCGVSEQEIGVDIQRIQGGEKLHLAKRFFSPGECRALEDCEDEEARIQMFFRMWTRKEAYGKLTGEGLAGVIGKDLWTEGAAERIVLPDVFLRSCREELAWEEYDVPAGCRIAVCKYR